MKIRRKVTKLQWWIFLAFTAIEFFIVANWLKSIQKYYFGDYRSYAYIRILIIQLCLNCVFALWFVDKQKKPVNKTKNNIWKGNSINFKFYIGYILFMIIKFSIYTYLVSRVTIKDFALTILLLVSGYVIINKITGIDVFTNKIKTKILKRCLKANEKNESLSINNMPKIVLVEDNTYSIATSFDIDYENDYEISKNLFYISYNKELPKLLKEYPKCKELILKNCVAFLKISDREGDQIEKFVKECEEKGLNQKHNLLILANSKVTSKPDKYNVCDYVQFCEEKQAIQFTEIMLKEVKILRRDEEFSPVSEGDNYISIGKCKKRYNDRFLDEEEHYPKAQYLKTLYKNAFAQDNPNTSYLILLNYINALCQIFSYYIYLKNSDDDKNEINYSILKDDYDNFAYILKKYLNEDDSLYTRIRKQEFDILLSLKDCINYFLGPLIDAKFTGETITFYGLIEVINQIRNKLQAHGKMDEKYSYIFWVLIYRVTQTFNEIFEVEKLEIFEEKGLIYATYDGKDKVQLTPYVTKKNEGNVYIMQSSSGYSNQYDYIDYLEGEYIKPDIKKGRILK